MSRDKLLSSRDELHTSRDDGFALRGSIVISRAMFYYTARISSYLYAHAQLVYFQIVFQ